MRTIPGPLERDSKGGSGALPASVRPGVARSGPTKVECGRFLARWSVTRSADPGPCCTGRRRCRRQRGGIAQFAGVEARPSLRPTSKKPTLRRAFWCCIERVGSRSRAVGAGGSPL